MSVGDERLFRVVYSSITASRLSSKEIRRLVELLSGGSEFVQVLQKELWEFAGSLEHSFPKQPQLAFRSDEVEAGSALSEIILDRVQSERLSKQKLVSMLGSTSKRAAKGLDPSKKTMRQLIQHFLDHASPDEVAALASLVGLAVSQDPFLRGIDRKSRGSS